VADPVPPPSGGGPTPFSFHTKSFKQIRHIPLNMSPCSGCNDENPALTFREGTVLMRFIRAKKTPPGSMSNFKDGEAYWQIPIHATLPWWEPVEDIQLPIVEKAGEALSVYDPSRLDDEGSPAYLGPSGMSLQPGGRVSGAFTEPAQVVIGDDPPHPESKKETVNLGFPQGESPSRKWLKEDLFLFVKSRGGTAKMRMKKGELLAEALKLTSKSS